MTRCTDCDGSACSTFDCPATTQEPEWARRSVQRVGQLDTRNGQLTVEVADVNVPRIGPWDCLVVTTGHDTVIMSAHDARALINMLTAGLRAISL